MEKLRIHLAFVRLCSQPVALSCGFAKIPQVADEPHSEDGCTEESFPPRVVPTTEGIPNIHGIKGDSTWITDLVI